MTAASAVVLDVGNVLLDWNPRALYLKIFRPPGGQPDAEKADWFLANICTQLWNVQQDSGRSITEANAALIRQHPKWRAEIEAYYARFDETIIGAIESTVACMRDLRSTGVPVHGLTNFGRETFAMAQGWYDFLNEFDGVVVSGEEGLIKPDPEIFKLTANRFKLTPVKTLFVDDSRANIDAARALGFQVHHFTNPAALRPHLIELGLLAD
ncbi:MAG: HAD family phosphatase [Alphaproteobacteria bacterium]|jgi:2-haloacid dehalogenase|nr:HAD family phosphatase [Alphaproteobacteria bacterium]